MTAPILPQKPTVILMSQTTETTCCQRFGQWVSYNKILIILLSICLFIVYLWGYVNYRTFQLQEGRAK
uniref:Uncharacterized protein n=1 Tax=Caenorhabditis tropicalis TaxID=1561998 RepID=A0A1I7UBI9_9PELO